MHEHVVAGAMRIERIVFNRSARFGTVAVHPAIESFAIEEQQPAIAALCFAQRVFRDWSDRFYSNISITDKLFCKIAAAVDLQRDTARIRMPARSFGPIAKLDAVDPSGDVRRIS